ncbi:MAG TPA: MTH938/NDUFAF3 family protein [Candidatus Dormibacteraeota bacterium]|nr:MTH938/NDUFAF3 family protein [Candidatus Dormibacteraeota bacterium]
MTINKFSFGSVRIDGQTFERDVVIDRGQVRLRNKKPSKRYRDEFGHTPLSVDEKIPWKCKHLVIGTGADGALPVMAAVRDEARRRDVELTVVKTKRAIDLLNHAAAETNAILHITC